MIKNKYLLPLVVLLIIVLMFMFAGRTTLPVEQAIPSPIISEHVYTSSTLGFTIHYPLDFIVDDHYLYQALGPGRDIPGVRFTIPSKMATGTNLSTDSYLSVEQITGTSPCSANLFLGEGSTTATSTDAGVTYSVASSTGAAAGNRYEETVFALPGSPCVALRYMVHYGVIENYPIGTIHEFNRATLFQQFDKIRRSLSIVPK